MSELFPASKVAEILGKDKSTICRRAKAHGIGQMVGVARVFTSADIARLEKLVQDGPGNPNFSPGNYFGGAKKRQKPRKNKAQK